MSSVIARWCRPCGLALLLCSSAVQAEFSIPGIELVQSVPVQTPLQAADLRQTETVWREMFANARGSIDIAQFYVADQPGSRLGQVLDALQAAGERGVKIRLLVEEKGLRISEPATLERLRAIPNLTLNVLPFARVSGGIIHAKYLLVDRKQAFIGSQNFDWRALEHIHETGLRIDDPQIVAQTQAIFDQDWQAQAQIAAGQPVTAPAAGNAPAPVGNYLVASPRRFNPPGVIDSQAELPRLLAQAEREVRVQLLDYVPLSYSDTRQRPYYALIDNAVRAAAARGVKVKLMVSDWNTDKPDIAYLKSLAVLPNVEVRIVAIPRAREGFIPYARVTHSKVMVIDGQIGWVGTSNWQGGYLDNSRNLEVVMRSAPMAERLGQLHEQLWNSPYAQALDIMRDYPQPHPGKP